MVSRAHEQASAGVDILTSLAGDSLVELARASAAACQHPGVGGSYEVRLARYSSRLIELMVDGAGPMSRTVLEFHISVTALRSGTSVTCGIDSYTLVNEPGDMPGGASIAAFGAYVEFVQRLVVKILQRDPQAKVMTRGADLLKVDDRPSERVETAADSGGAGSSGSTQNGGHSEARHAGSASARSAEPNGASAVGGAAGGTVGGSGGAVSAAGGTSDPAGRTAAQAVPPKPHRLVPASPIAPADSPQQQGSRPPIPSAPWTRASTPPPPPAPSVPHLRPGIPVPPPPVTGASPGMPSAAGALSAPPQPAQPLSNAPAASAPSAPQSSALPSLAPPPPPPAVGTPSGVAPAPTMSPPTVSAPYVPSGPVAGPPMSEPIVAVPPPPFVPHSVAPTTQAQSPPAPPGQFVPSPPPMPFPSGTSPSVVQGQSAVPYTPSGDARYAPPAPTMGQQAPLHPVPAPPYSPPAVPTTSPAPAALVPPYSQAAPFAPVPPPPAVTSVPVPPPPPPSAVVAPPAVATTPLPGTEPTVQSVPVAVVTAPVDHDQDELSDSDFDEIDVTILSSAKASAPVVRLRAESGETYDLPRGTFIVGRRPSRNPGVSGDLLKIADISRTMSKNHAIVEVRPEGIRVTDTGSTNGTRLLAATGDDVVLEAEPDASFDVTAGGRIQFGDLTLSCEQL